MLARIPPRLTVSIERETFPRMLDRPGRLFALQSDAYWIDIGTPAKYLEAHADVLAGALGVPPAPGAVRGPGRMDAGQCFDRGRRRVKRPVLLGPDVNIASGGH